MEGVLKILWLMKYLETSVEQTSVLRTVDKDFKHSNIQWETFVNMLRKPTNLQTPGHNASTTFGLTVCLCKNPASWTAKCHSGRKMVSLLFGQAKPLGWTLLAKNTPVVADATEISSHAIWPLDPEWHFGSGSQNVSLCLSNIPRFPFGMSKCNLLHRRHLCSSTECWIWFNDNTV